MFRKTTELHMPLKVLLIHGQFSKCGHVMFRCFTNMFRQVCCRNFSVNLQKFFNSVAADDGGMPVLEETHSVEEVLSFDIVLDKLHELNQRFSTTPAACVKIMQRLNHITTATQWETFVQTQGASVNCSYRSGSAIRVQPTSLSRRRPAVTRGSTEPLIAPRGGRPEGSTEPLTAVGTKKWLLEEDVQKGQQSP